MKEELGELHARHETDASLILEWRETSRNLERQYLQQQAEVERLKGMLGSKRLGEAVGVLRQNNVEHRYLLYQQSTYELRLL